MFENNAVFLNEIDPINTINIRALLVLEGNRFLYGFYKIKICFKAILPTQNGDLNARIHCFKINLPFLKNNVFTFYYNDST